MNVDQLVPDFADPGAPPDGIERHARDGRPKINGKYYSRPSSLGNYLEDSSNLEKWKARRAAQGYIARPELLAQIAAIGPDRDSQEDEDEARDVKRQINAIIEAACTAGGADKNREYGTALHKITERIDLGEPVDVPEMWRADVDAYLAATSGFKWLAVERFVVCEAVQAAGTPDRYGLTPDGRVCVFDTKGGASLDFGGLKFGIQMATYAHADYFYAVHNGQPVIEPIPWDVDKTEGIIVHLEVGTGVCTLHSIDLADGWEAAQEALRVREWRNKGRRMIRPYTATGTVNVEVDVDTSRFDEAVRLSAPGDGKASTATPPTLTPEPVIPTRTWDTLAQRRLRAQEIKDRKLSDELLKQWPKRPDGSVPSLLAPADVTSDEWKSIDAALEAVEKAHGLFVEDVERDVLKARHDELPSDLKAEFGAWYATTGWNGAYRMTRGQADATIEALHPLNLRAAERKAQVTQHLAMVDEATAEAVLRLVVRPERIDTVLADLGQILELEAEAVGCVVDAIEGGVLAPWPLPDDAARVGLGLCDNALINTKGLRDAARPIAERHGLPAPKSAEAVLASPLLAALTWAAQ